MWKSLKKRCALICDRKSKSKKPSRSPSPTQANQIDNTLFQTNQKFYYRPGNVLYNEGIIEVSQGFSLNGELIIIKKLRLPKDQDVQAICNILKRLIKVTKDWEHPNLVKYLGAEYNTESGEFLIFTESITSDYESMIKIIQDEQHIRFLIYQIFKALKFLFDNGLRKIGNIKPSNLLWDTNGIIKIRDYIGNDYFKTLRKIQNVSKPSDSVDPRTNEDLIEIRRLIINIGFRLKLSHECLNFIMVLEKLACNDTVDFSVIFSHPFMKIDSRPELETNYSRAETLLSNLHVNYKRPFFPEGQIRKFDSDSFQESMNLKRTNNNNEASLVGQDNNMLRLWQNQSINDTNSVPKLSKTNSEFDFENTLNKPLTQILPSKPSTSSTPKFQNSTTNNLEDTHLSNLVSKQQLLIEKMMNAGKPVLTEKNPLKEISPEISVHSEETPDPSSNASPNQSPAPEFSYKQLINILKEQNKYIQYLEKKFNDNSSMDPEINNTDSFSQTNPSNLRPSRVQKNVINNNIIITNIGQQFNARDLNTFMKKNQAQDFTAPEKYSGDDESSESQLEIENNQSYDGMQETPPHKSVSEYEQPSENLDAESFRENSKSFAKDNSSSSISEKSFHKKNFYF